ncbi:MAG: rod shape-determining protein MreD [Paraglaciecola sp.]|uniref:rod shape-determining protein MreD n=1 Tax=Pseudomonadati TaxID=3379134 RepID=UPI00273D9745|nr:rod shape-determining protein MreD [Paraglaciecola sp.]MDP5029682.1 rod shape-determining protein MreD [Paraglaciecola sp.]MDP5131598.1 rod shape-determining protein MreD [Paraglaciecola sp.]
MQFRAYAIALSLLCALVLQIMPMPASVDLYRPEWVLLVLSYWTLALPHRVNIGIAFINGLILDILLGSSLGVHSLAMCVSIYVLAANYQRLRNYSVWQQAIVIGVTSAFYNLIVFWLQHMLTDVYFLITYMWPVVSSMVIWPWLFWLLRKLRRQLRLS